MLDERSQKDAAQLFESFVSNAKVTSIERLRHLPRDIPKFLEPRTRSLYFETFWALVLGLYGTAIQNCGILLEMFLKEIWYFKINKEYEGKFHRLIHDCHTRGFITKEEKEWADKIRFDTRNPYLHSDYAKLTKGAKIMGMKVEFTSPQEALEKIKEVSEKGMPREKIELFEADKLRFIQDISKIEKDKRDAIGIFWDLDEFIRKKVSLFNPPKNSTQKNKKCQGRDFRPAGGKPPGLAHEKTQSQSEHF